MKVTRNVVNDLLPLYQAGEASEDSRALVEGFLRENPDFQKEFSQRAAASDSLLTGPLPAPDPNLERITLERTRRFNRNSRFFLGLAIALWIVPFFPFYDGNGLWFMWARNPFTAVLCIVLSTLITSVQTFVEWRWRRKKSRG